MLLLSTMNSQLEAVQQRICTVKGRILRSQQDLVAAKEAKNEKQERLLYELLLSPYTQVNALYKQLNGLQEKKNILLHSQAQRSLPRGMAVEGTVRKWGSNMVSVMVRGETTPVQLYLAAGESDQATSGHIFMDNLRTIMHGLPVDVPIMLCEDIHARFLEGDMMHRDVNDLSQKQFKAGSELIAWPGTLDGVWLQMLSSVYNVVVSTCQHVAAVLTVGIKDSKED
ncbi:hypothetical protein ABBQ38_013101 [Trebouxia sp. C0009 RCD-2024]